MTTSRRTVMLGALFAFTAIAGMASQTDYSTRSLTAQQAVPPRVVDGYLIIDNSDLPAENMQGGWTSSNNSQSYQGAARTGGFMYKYVRAENATTTQSATAQYVAYQYDGLNGNTDFDVYVSWPYYSPYLNGQATIYVNDDRVYVDQGVVGPIDIDGVAMTHIGTWPTDSAGRLNVHITDVVENSATHTTLLVYADAVAIKEADGSTNADECTSAIDCPIPQDSCFDSVCVDGQCGMELDTANNSCSHMTSECTFDHECPQSNSPECLEARCWHGECLLNPIAGHLNDLPQSCSGIVECISVQDCPIPQDSCFDSVCVDGQCGMELDTANNSCSHMTSECTFDHECPQSNSPECLEARCWHGECLLNPIAGHLNDLPQSCSGIVECISVQDCPIPQDSCFDSVCVDGQCGEELSDGAPSHCLAECTNASNCPQPSDSACEEAVCDNGTCDIVERVSAPPHCQPQAAPQPVPQGWTTNEHDHGQLQQGDGRNGFVLCQQGQRIVNGGCAASGISNAQIRSSFPYVAQGGREGWFCSYIAGEAGLLTTIAYAQCQ